MGKVHTSEPPVRTMKKLSGEQRFHRVSLTHDLETLLDAAAVLVPGLGGLKH